MTRTTSRFFPLMLAVTLVACATPEKGKPKDSDDHEKHHPKSSLSTMPSRAGTNMGMMGSMNMNAMCEMRKNMMTGKSQAEHQGMKEHPMKSMSPEMYRQHMEMMDSHCKPT